MNIESRKLELINLLLKTKKESLLSKIKNIFEKEESENKFDPMTIEEFNNRIDKSMEDSKTGRTIASDELKQDMEQWK